MTLRKTIVGSPLLLPLVVLGCCVLWVLPDVREPRLWAGLAVALLTAYGLMEWNNRFQLLRIRSRMVSATYLVVLTALPRLHLWSRESVAPLCLVLCLLLLSSVYQERRSEAGLFHAFLVMGLASFVYGPLLLLLPVLLFSAHVHLRALSLRSLVAGLLGAALPYWFYAAWMFCAGELDGAFADMVASFRFPRPDYSLLTPSMWASAGVVSLLAFISTCHFVRYAYNDKIRTRMLFYQIILVELFLLAALWAQPQQFYRILRLLLVGVAPLSAHYFALARGGWWFTLWFLLWIAAVVALAFV